MPAADEGRSEKKHTFIGPNLHFVGEIESWGSVRIEGKVEGKMTVGTLTVGPAGSVEGPVVADLVRIDGTLEGDLDADTVVLGSESQVVGDITHRSLSMKPGARFEGKAKLKDTGPPLPSAEEETQSPGEPSDAAPSASLASATPPSTSPGGKPVTG